MTDEKIDKISPAHYRLPLRISEGFRNLGAASNKPYRWGRLCERMQQTVYDNITMEEYNALSPRDRHERKNHGWFVGGQFKDGRRKIANIDSRSILTFDIDECSIELYQELRDRPPGSFLSEFEYFLYTTRSHTPEHPRVRVVIPLAREITKAEFGPVIRILAYRVHPGMDQIDPVSYRVSQLMFWPTTSSDGEFVHRWNKGHLLDPDEILKGWNDDWTDYSRLPRSPRETARIRPEGGKPQNPKDKRGVIGAWCRAHGISEIIEEWLGDKYTIGDTQADGTQRYTYLPGSTTNGMVVYDNDMFAYSNHSTDPGADQNLNPFDFMRVHYFGHLDKVDAFDEDTDVTQLRSYKAMTEFAQADPDTLAELRLVNYDLEALANDSHWDLEDDDPPTDGPQEAAAKPPEPVQPAAAPADPDWMNGLSASRDGLIKSDLNNVILILENDPRFKGAFAYNQFVNETVMVRRIRSPHLRRDTGPIKNTNNGDPVADVMAAITRSIIEAPRGEGRGWGIKVSEQNIWAAIHAVAYRNAFHPVRQYLEGCKWDGVPRLRKMLHTYWHVEDNDYHEQVGYLMMVAAVARVYEPGHKFDVVPIFEGKQGIMKSTAIAVLAVNKSWFVEFHAEVGMKRELVENIGGKWFVEMPEIAPLMNDRRASVEALKAMFSGQSDRARPAYGRGASDFPRQCIFVGSTNNRDYLRDATGNRRYWVIEVPDRPIDVVGLRRDIDVIWAEVREEYRWFRRQPQWRDKSIALPLYLSGAEGRAAEELQGVKTMVTLTDIRKGRIVEWLDTPVLAPQAKPGWHDDGSEETEKLLDGSSKLLRDLVCIADVIEHVLHADRGDRSLCQEVGRTLSNLPGWIRRPSNNRCGKYGRQVVWERVNRKEKDDGD